MFARWWPKPAMSAVHTPNRKRRAQWLCSVPRVEELEQRLAPATFTVVNTGDTGAGVGLTGDLRFCINQANAAPGPDAIDFLIPGAGVQTINLISALPSIVDQ